MTIYHLDKNDVIDINKQKVLFKILFYFKKFITSPFPYFMSIPLKYFVVITFNVKLNGKSICTTSYIQLYILLLIASSQNISTQPAQRKSVHNDKAKCYACVSSECKG